MPSLSLPLHPSTLQAFRPPQQNPFQTAPATMGGAPTPRPVQGPPNAMPAFPGAAQPGPFAQPAPFNPLLAQALLGPRGFPSPMSGPPGGGMQMGMGGGIGPSMLQRIPPGGFGTSPQAQPARRNPYLSR